jgi:hypothetical protein
MSSEYTLRDKLAIRHLDRNKELLNQYRFLLMQDEYPSQQSICLQNVQSQGTKHFLFFRTYILLMQLCCYSQDYNLEPHILADLFQEF